MYEAFYGLRERPFTIVPNPGYLYMSPKHKLALAHLKYGLIEGSGFVVLTGGIGTGKTTLIRFVLAKIQKALDVAVVFNTNVTGEELLRLIIRELEAGIPGADKAANLAMLNDFLIERYSCGRHAIVIIDEAQNLSRDALEEVRLLSNLQGTSRPLLQVVLVGQPELRAKLADPTLIQLAQRITSTFHLASLDLEEVAVYIGHRVALAGGPAGLFDRRAVEAVHAVSGGVPRLINIICDAALVHGFADSLPVITGEVIDNVVQEMADILHSRGHDEAAVKTATPGPGIETVSNAALDKLAERVSVLEQKLKALHEKSTIWGTDVALLSGEVGKLKNLLSTPALRGGTADSELRNSFGGRIGAEAASEPRPEISAAPAGKNPQSSRSVKSLFGWGKKS